MPSAHPRKPRTTLIIMAMLSLTVLTLSSKDVPVLGSIRSSVIDGSGPVGRIGRSATKPFRSWWGSVTNYEDLQAENADLLDEIDRLEAKQARNATAAAELEKLKELEGIEFIGDIDSRIAAVATGPFSSFDNNTLLLDRGASSGFKVGMPVVTNAGLVGRLESVTDKRSVVKLITDSKFTVSVKIAETGVYGIGQGNGERNPFVVDGLALDAQVEKGYYIVTSGIESAQFPKDLVVGQVTDISESGSTFSRVLDVDLSVEFREISAVRVLLWEPEE